MCRSSRSLSEPDPRRTGAAAGPVPRTAARPGSRGSLRLRGLRWPLGLSAGLALALTAAGCAVIDVKAEGRITTRKGWVLLPVQNLGETHMAGERVEELLTALLRIQKNVELAPYTPAAKDKDKEAAAGGAAALAAAKGGKQEWAADSELELDERSHYERVVAWAREHRFAYGIGGSVQEWRYRAGTEGEPAVGLTLRVVDLGTGRVVFTAAGASPTPGRGSLSSATQSLLRAMLTRLPLDSEPAPAGK